LKNEKWTQKEESPLYIVIDKVIDGLD